MEIKNPSGRKFLMTKPLTHNKDTLKRCCFVGCCAVLFPGSCTLREHHKDLHPSPDTCGQGLTDVTSDRHLNILYVSAPSCSCQRTPARAQCPSCARTCYTSPRLLRLAETDVLVTNVAAKQTHSTATQRWSLRAPKGNTDRSRPLIPLR